MTGETRARLLRTARKWTTPLALRLAAALAHATFAASVLLPALVTVRCAVGADGADRAARGAG